MKHEDHDWLSAIVAAMIVLCITPILTFAFGFAGGAILRFVFGSLISDTLNTVFSTNRFHPELIPPICGMIAVIGGCFKTSISSAASKD